MSSFLETIIIVSFLFIIGVAGGLEQGMVSIPGAIIAFAVGGIIGVIAFIARCHMQRQ